MTQGGQRYTPLAEAFLLASPVLVPLDQQTNATVNTAAFADLDGDGWDEAYLAGRFFPGVPSAACCALPTYPTHRDSSSRCICILANPSVTFAPLFPSLLSHANRSSIHFCSMGTRRPVMPSLLSEKLSLVKSMSSTPCINVGLLLPRTIVGHLAPPPKMSESTDELLGSTAPAADDDATKSVADAMFDATRVDQLCARAAHPAPPHIA